MVWFIGSPVGAAASDAEIESCAISSVVRPDGTTQDAPVAPSIDVASLRGAAGVAFTAEEKLGEIVIAIHNEGPPIGLADRERIFERFYRAEETRHRAPGTGLGLSIAKKAAEAHGGRTWVVSEEAAGTTFYFALPRGIRRQVDSVARQDSDR